MDKRSIGNAGEETACRYLSDRGIEILLRNYRVKGVGEVDVIARSSDGTLIFLEVKTMRELPSGLMPEDHIDRRKLNAMRAMAQLFSAKHSELIGEVGFRIDVICIQVKGNSNLTEPAHYVVTNYFENVC